MPHLVRLRPSRRLLALLFAVLLAAQISGAQAKLPSPLDDRISSQVIKLRNGITLNYAVQGDPKGPVIVMLHGAGDSWHSFARVLPLIPRAIASMQLRCAVMAFPTIQTPATPVLTSPAISSTSSISSISSTQPSSGIHLAASLRRRSPNRIAATSTAWS